ncbi:MAG: M66 family metalloprotease [Gemmatimonadota bacterium]|nr:M66 family metalloprotease [Gemmatimonadota bacterium]
MSGHIPRQLGGMDRIRRLSIGDNDLTGPIPPEIGQLATLEDFHVGRANLSGPIPPELGDLPALVSLGLGDNDFSGRVPPELGNIRTLESLSLIYNERLTGLIPRSLMRLESLSEFRFYRTGLCAQIDDEFQQWFQSLPDGAPADCDAATVERFALGDLHDRTGGGSWGQRDGWKGGGPVGGWHGVTVENGRVRELRLPGNGLRGPIPAELANLTELEVLDLGGNELAGELPRALTTLSEAVELRVADNAALDGVLPFGLTRLQRLEVLHYSGTGLCASPAATFQGWLAGIDDTSGATCGNVEQVSVSMPIVYLTQSVQDPSRSVRLVANRDALLRVFVTGDQPRAFFEPRVRATFLRGGREVYRMDIERYGDEMATVADEGELDLSYNAVIPAEHIAPGVRLVVEADPEGTVPRAPGSVVRFPASGSEPLDVVEVPPMELTVVPILEAEQPDSSIFEWTRGIDEDSPQVSLFRYAFPFADFTASTREPYVTSLDLTSDGGQWGLVLEMEALRAADNGTGYYYAAAASVNGYVRGRARLGAWASIGKAWDTELAHEVGHNLDLRHTPCGGALGTDPDFPYPDGSIGVWGYDFRDGSVLSPERRRDIMGYCYEQGWLSDYYFEKVIEYRERVEREVAAEVLARATAPSDMLVIWGGVVGGEIRLEPLFSMRTTARLPEQTGPYRIVGTGADGETAFSLAFTPGEDKFGDKYFFFTVPVQPGWDASLEEITLTGPEGTVTVNRDEAHAVSLVRDRASGRIRGILRNWDDALPAALETTGVMEVETTTRLSDALRLRR